MEGLARRVLVEEVDFCHGRDAAGSASKVFRLAGAGGGRIAWERHLNNVAFVASVARMKPLLSQGRPHVAGNALHPGAHFLP